MAQITVETPEAFKRLWEPSRYKVLYGGRGGAKSWNVARTLLAMGRVKPLRVLCTRELQVSINDSVHKLLSDQVGELGMEDFYTVQKTSITGPNGTEFGFAGIRSNTNKIKSFEGVDIVWVEEAATVTKASWDLLIPTIRKVGSEIWMTFNPELETDETFQRFVLSAPSNAILFPVSYRDNPWFPDVLRAEMNDLMVRDYKAYLHVWEGECMSALEGAIYKEELKALTDDRRITAVPYDKTKPVMTFWDLGFRDNTAVWFIQRDDMMYNIIDFFQDSFKALPYYLTILQQRGYVYGTHYLPHDGKRRSYDTGLTPEDRFRELGWQVVSVPRGDIRNGIEAGRAIMGMCRFDADKTFDGVQSLRRYRWSENGTNTPHHDQHSHGADAYRTFASAPFVQWDLYGEAAGQTVYRSKCEYDPLEMSADASGNYVYVR